MQRESQQQPRGWSTRKRMAKSNDLRQRLFEIGTAQSPKTRGHPSSPHRHAPQHLLSSLQRDNSAQLLRYQPPSSPNLIKTHSKEFLIRKSPKFPFSPKSRQSPTTLSNFQRPDSVRLDQKELREALHEARQELPDPCIEGQSRLDEYVGLILRGTQEMEEFLYLIRGNEENVYELELVGFEEVRSHEGQPNFEYYTVSRKGFCRYVGGKPQNFLEIAEWAQEKAVYSRIKSLRFFFRFRRWKTLQMWRRTVTRQRREAISSSLQEKLFLLDVLPRRTLLSLRSLTIDMQKAVLIIARNEGTYSLQSFKHCQERARREASLAVQEFSRESRAVVRKFFQDKLSDLRESIKKNDSDEKQASPTALGAQCPKEGAFQTLGFPANMSYSHRSRLRKQTGRFLRFSYLVDSLHLSCLTNLYSTQVQAFISRLQELQINESVRLRVTQQQGKDQINSERMFALHLLCNFREVPVRLVSANPTPEEFVPSRDIRLKDEQPGETVWVFRLSEYWLSLQPSLQQVLDQLTFLLKEGLSSLKCFERWSKHRQMQKYVNVLEEWDDLVSEHWEISQNDNLDPLIILDSLDPVLSRLKSVLKVTDTKLNDSLRVQLTPLLNAYWQYQSLDLNRLENPRLADPADTFDKFLTHTSSLLQNLVAALPHRIELGIVVVHVTKIKNILGQKFAGILQTLKTRLPELVEQRTAVLNEWLSGFGVRLREQILNINDYVRTVGIIRQAEAEFGERREECNEMAQLYQTMQQFKMDTRRRKDFETVTLKLKDQLDQLIIAAEQNIQRKADLYSREVLKYHLPMLLKDIARVLQATEQPKFLKLSISRRSVLSELSELQVREKDLVQQRKKCFQYMQALKLQEQKVQALDELSQQISARVILWQTLQKWQVFTAEVESQTVKDVQLSILIDEVQEFRKITRELQVDLPPNEVLTSLKERVEEYYIYLPLLDGFAGALSDQHWNQIYQNLPEKFGLDLRKREFSVRQFLASGLGAWAKVIQFIFEKSKVEAKLQTQYHHLEDHWASLLAKVRVEGRFNIIANGDTLRSQLNNVLYGLTETLADPHAQTLKQYSITYESLLSQQQCLQEWLHLQERLLQLQKLSRLLDLKKLPDYSYFQNAERLYKQISKTTLVKGAEAGLKLGKLLLGATEDKLAEIAHNLDKMQNNITSILAEHRRAFPAFYLFNDHQLLPLITEPSHQAVENAAKRLFPGLLRLEFENERVMSLVTVDGQKLYKNPISLSSQVEQVLLQLGETISETHRRSLRGCRYKALQSNLTSLVQSHNLQHLLAISRVDFSHYTGISIDNQQDTSDSLIQFRKVMRKDTAEDIRNRQFLNDTPAAEPGAATPAYKYDSLLLQQLLYEEVLDRLIRTNVQRAEDYEWASQLRFQWEDSPGDQTNITVRQLHLVLKYGNDFIGSQVKVILQSQPELLLGLKLSQPTLFAGSPYVLERTLHAIGYKTCQLHCSPLVTQEELSQFAIGCYFSDYLPILTSSDLLSPNVKAHLDPLEWLSHFREHSLKRNSPYLRDGERIFTLYSTLRDTHTQIHCLGSNWRVIEYRPPSPQLIGSGMQIFGIFNQQKHSLLLRVFQLVQFLEERSEMQGVSLQQFIDDTLMDDPNSQEQQLFTRLLTYLKPKVALQTHHALSKHLEDLGLVSLDPQVHSCPITHCLWERSVLVLAGKGHSKRHSLEAQLQKESIPLVPIFGKSLDMSTLFSDQFSPYLLKRCPQGKCVLYLEQVTLQLLQALQKLLYHSSFFVQHPGVAIVLDVPQLDQFLDPRALASFPLMSIETPKKLVQSLVAEWNQRHLQGERARNGVKTMNELVIPCLQALEGKQELVLQTKFRQFLRYLQSLLPVKNPLEACIYCLSLMYRGREQDLLKLQYLTRKALGEDYYSQEHRLGQLIYSSSAIKEGMITETAFLRNYTEEHPLKDISLLMTPQLAHLITAARRVLQNTGCGVVAEGPGNSGKSTLLKTYRQRYHEDSFYLCLWGPQANSWNNKIESVLQSHGLDLLGARINYRETVLLVQDLHLAEPHWLTPLQLMLAYRRWQCPSKAEARLLNVKLLISSSHSLDLLSQSTLRLKMGLDGQSFKGIFSSLLKQNSDPEWEVPVQTFSKIALSSYQICLKVTQEVPGQIKQTFRLMHRLVAGFGQLRIKDPHTPSKQIERFWSFSLEEALRGYDQQGSLSLQLQKAGVEQRPGLLSYSHLSGRSMGRRVETVKDVKRLYNVLNERIQKYNEGENKRYGQSFQFLNFDCLLEKVVSLSHSLLMQQDHMLVGRAGTNKHALVQLSAFLNGLHFRLVQGPVLPVLLELADSNIPMPTLLLKQIRSTGDEQQLEDYCYLDIEAEVLARSQGKQRVGVREKKEGNPLKATRKDQTVSETYSMPRAKPSWDEVEAFRQSYRLVATLTPRQEAVAVPRGLRSRFQLDVVEEVPVASLLQYNQKLLGVDGVTCGDDAQDLNAQLHGHSRKALGLSLRANDDCVRLFSSFLSNLVPEMTLESDRFGKVLLLLDRLRNCSIAINASLCQCHARLKDLALGESIKQDKMQIELELRQKSTALAISQKLGEILGWLQPSYRTKHEQYEKLLGDRRKLEMTFALTACYFVYLSHRPYVERRRVLAEWKKNIPLMQEVPELKSFLPLFLLQEEQFNAEPVDDLPDFYENMAVIFHSAKPVALKDKCGRGRAWLEKNCSFIHLYEDQKDFMELLAEHLSKPTNLLVQATSQQSVEALPNTTLGTLLFLPEAVSTVSIGGEELAVNPEAKVYLLLGQGVELPARLTQQFTVVLYEQNEAMVQRALTHEYLSQREREWHLSGLDWLRKVRNLRLDCDNAMSQVAESIYEQLCGTEPPGTQQSLLEGLSKITDKLMIRAQNQFTKIKQKEEMIVDFQEKAELAFNKLHQAPALEFHQVAMRIREALLYLASKDQQVKTYVPDYPQFFSTIRVALSRGIVSTTPLLLLLALRQWGPMLSPSLYVLFAFLLVLAHRGLSPQDLTNSLTPQDLHSGSILALLGRPSVPVLRAQMFQEQLARSLSQLIGQQELSALTTIFSCVVSNQPVVWLNSQEYPQRISLEISNCSASDLREQLLMQSARLLQPTLEQSLQSLLKKSLQEDNLQVLCPLEGNREECIKVLQTWNLQEHTVLIVQGRLPPKTQFVFPFNAMNQQGLFKRITQLYTQSQEICLMRAHHSRPTEEELNQPSQSVKDPSFALISSAAREVRLAYKAHNLPLPLLSAKQFQLLSKSIQLSQSPLTLYSKSEYHLKYLRSTLHPPTFQLSQQIDAVLAKVGKLAHSEQLSLKESTALKEDSDEVDGTMMGMDLELGWLATTRQLLGLPACQLAQKYTQIMDTYIRAYEQCREEPTVERSNRRQQPVRQRKQSMMKKNMQRESKKKERRITLNKNNGSRPLATLILLRESQHYQKLLAHIHQQLLETQQQLKQYQRGNWPLLTTLHLLETGQTTSQWSYLLANTSCAGEPLESALQRLLARRNELFTLHSKMAVSDSCEVDFKNLRRPQDFLRAYFGSPLQDRDPFVLATQLTEEEAEGQDYLRVQGLWGAGWRLSGEGIIQHVGENKVVQLGGCFLIKKSSLGIGFCGVEVGEYLGEQSFMRVHCQAKKVVNGLRLYLRSQ